MKKILGIALFATLSLLLVAPAPAYAGCNPFAPHTCIKHKFNAAKKKADDMLKGAKNKHKLYTDHAKEYVDFKNKKFEMHKERWEKKAELKKDRGQMHLDRWEKKLEMKKERGQMHLDRWEQKAELKQERGDMHLDRWKKKAELKEERGDMHLDRWQQKADLKTDRQNMVHRDRWETRNQMLQTQPVLGVAQTQPAQIQPKDNGPPQPMYAGTASGGTVFVDGTNVTVVGASNGGTTAEQQNIRNIISELNHMYGGGGTVHNGTP